MRVPRTPTDMLSRRGTKARRTAASRRRVEGRSDAATAAPSQQPAPAEAPDLRAERRMREAGGPDDRAHYRCVCGYAFDAAVSTSVSCPHCGTAQAW